MTYTDKPAFPFAKILRGSSVSLLIVIVLVALVPRCNVDEDEQAIYERFHVTSPNAQITIDDHASDYSTGILDISRGASVVLFRSDAIKSLIKKWQFRLEGQSSLNEIAHFHGWEWNFLGGGRYQNFHQKRLPYYSCPNIQFVPQQFSTTTLIWDAETGRGCFYIFWSD